ncbi:glutathione S-transferase family protein [uncultured Sphingomonas sp.]|uniref:glutathione S-transferase family protein n=1 Tax=uncultured Sphingomonas sp. TaxID=158754 RepID=UPI0035CC1CFD
MSDTAASDLVLHHFPNACSQTSLFALEEAGLEYELCLVDLATDEQSSPRYAAISPLGKVPALQIGATVLAENAAILTYIAAAKPEAGLFPAPTTPFALAERQAGLSFCGGTVHPIVRGIAAPYRLTDGEPGPVRSRAVALAEKNFTFADRRLAERGWWLGEWSVIDVYLNWAMQTAVRGGFDLTPYPELARLPERLTQRPAFKRTMRIEEESLAVLAARRVS